jgi:hypothetical protein
MANEAITMTKIGEAQLTSYSIYKTWPELIVSSLTEMYDHALE